jgi:hypothetical protein
MLLADIFDCSAIKMNWRRAVKNLLGHYAPPILTAINARSSLQMDERCVKEGFGEAELGIVRYLCDKGKTSIDVGANAGRYTFAMRGYSR